MYKVQWIISYSDDGDIESWLQGFLLDRRIRQVSPGSIRFYKQKLGPFVDWCGERGLTSVLELTPHELRLFLLHMEANHNPGGRHAFYRSVRAFLNFFEEEAEPLNWRNPIKKVSAPRVADNPIEPIPVAEISKLIEACDGKTFYGARDRAIFLTLLDTGVRTMELAAINLEDVNLVIGCIQIQKGKGGRVRVVLFGKKTRKALRLWIRHRPKDVKPLFTTWEVADSSTVDFGAYF